MTATTAEGLDTMSPQRRRHPPDDHDAVLSTLPPGQMLRNSVGVVATARQFINQYHDAPGRFYVDGSKVYCRGEEPEAAYTIVGDDDGECTICEQPAATECCGTASTPTKVGSDV